MISRQQGQFDYFLNLPNVLFSGFVNQNCNEHWSADTLVNSIISTICFLDFLIKGFAYSYFDYFKDLWNIVSQIFLIKGLANCKFHHFNDLWSVVSWIFLSRVLPNVNLMFFWLFLYQFLNFFEHMVRNVWLVVQRNNDLQSIFASAKKERKDLC